MNSTEKGMAALSPKEKRGLLARLLWERASGNNSFPLSFAQERLWVLDQLDPGNPAYNIPSAFHLSGRLNMAALEQSLREIVRRHEVLRTTLGESCDQPVQVVHPNSALALCLADLCGVAPDQRVKLAENLSREEARHPFDLQRGSLIRVTLLRIEVDEYLLLVTIHHIAADGWSLGILVREVSALYTAFSAGQPSLLAEMAMPYVNYALLQRERWRVGEFENQLSYWRYQLARSGADFDLPTDKPRPPVQTFHGQCRRFTLSSGLTRRVRQLSRHEAVTSFMTLLAAWTVLLSRYSGQERIVVGSPIAGRNCPEIEKQIGLFVNTVVLNIDLSGEPTVRELLGRVKDICLGAHANQELPFERLVEALVPERDTSRSPIFQVMFVLQNIAMPPLILRGLSIQACEIDTNTAKFDLTLIINEEVDAFRGVIEYNTDLFDPSSASRFACLYTQALEAMVTDATSSIAALDLLTSADRNKLLVEWNASATAYPRDLGLHELFERQAALTPHAVALVCGGEQVTYRELDMRANRLAWELRRRGAGPETVVGICAERSIHLVTALFGTLKSGAAYLPLDPTYPVQRLAFMVEDAHALLVLTAGTPIPEVPVDPGKMIRMEHLGMACSGSSQRPSWTRLGESLAYVIYTSGSTGRPKGVMISHGSAVAFIHWAATVFSPEELSGCLASTSISFDLAVFELFLPLSFGGRVILARDGLHLPSAAESASITLINTVPSVFEELLHDGRVPPCVHTINLAGEPLVNSIVRRAYRDTNAAQIYNLYGPTENTIYSTYALLPREIGSTVPIGHPIANTQVYLVDPRLRPVPVGAVGFLCLAGDGLARGYYNRPDLTAESFMPSPFGSGPGKRLYQTGDLARYRADAVIEFIGRRDQQVKVRGFRIELHEIESRLMEHPAVQAAVVSACRDRFNSYRLIAYIVGPGTSNITSSAWRHHLMDHLPTYMIPSAFIVLETLPLTPSGKIDRSALPRPRPDRPLLETEYLAPRTGLVRTIARIWQEVLQLERLGANDNFFDLGGNSLLAVRVQRKLAAALGRDIPLIDIFRCPTVSSLADYLKGDSVEQAPLSDLDKRVERRKTMMNNRKLRIKNKVAQP